MIRTFMRSPTWILYSKDLNKKTVERFISKHGQRAKIYITTCIHCGVWCAVEARFVLRDYLLNKSPAPSDESYKPRPLCKVCFEDLRVRRMYIRLAPNTKLQPVDGGTSLENFHETRAQSPNMRRALGRKISFRYINDQNEVFDDSGIVMAWTYALLTICEDPRNKTAKANSRSIPNQDIVRGSVRLSVKSTGFQLLDGLVDGIFNVLSGVTDSMMGEDAQHTTHIEVLDETIDEKIAG